ncbi:MAG: hypothetical protein KJ626_15395 [Verrucomicrobia bacterium]|nr:hypothetical protein [Verrucomicrobiota bacterium]
MGASRILLTLRRRPGPHEVFYIGIALNAALFLILLACPYLPCIPMVLPTDLPVYLIANPLLNHFLLALCLTLPAATLLAKRRVTSAYSKALYPLALLPLSFVGFFVPCMVGTNISANVLFFLPLVLVSLVLLRLVLLFSDRLDQIPTGRIALSLLIALTVLFAVAGIHVSLQIGEHAVDEGHYIIQAESLYLDHDLDIRNNFGFDVDAEVEKLMKERIYAPDETDAVRQEVTSNLRSYLHVSPGSRDDHWYSWHPYGLSLLLAPVGALGMPGRQMVLALISAFGCMMIFLLCEKVSNSKSWSLVLTSLLAASSFWVAYSIRALPEILGASLFVTAVYAALLAERRPLRSFLMVAFCCGFMIVAHPRFAPCALLAAGYYYVSVLFIIRFPRRVRLLHLASLASGVLIVGGYLLLSHVMFENPTSYSTLGLFWAYPEGGWLILFSERGLFYSLPAAVLMVIALACALVTDRRNLPLHVVAFLALLGMILSIGTADCWDGGPTIAGRYLVVVVPLLMPAAVLLVKRCSTWGKGWAIFLFVYSASYTLPCLFNMPDVGEAFLHSPLEAVKQGLPLLRDLFSPYSISDIMIGHPYRGLAALTANPFPPLLFVVSLFLVVPRRVNARFAVPLLLLFFILSACLHNTFGIQDFSWPPSAVESALSRTPLQKARVLSCGESGPPIQITDYANRFDRFSPVSLTLSDLGKRQEDRTFSQPHLDANGWEDKGYRWFSPVTPFECGISGPHLLTIEGTTRGDFDPIVAVKEGRRPVYYQRLPRSPEESFSFSTIIQSGHYRGDTYILLRLEGEDGTLAVKRIVWTPIPGYELSRFSRE